MHTMTELKAYPTLIKNLLKLHLSEAQCEGKPQYLNVAHHVCNGPAASNVYHADAEKHNTGIAFSRCMAYTACKWTHASAAFCRHDSRVKLRTTLTVISKHPGLHLAVPALEA